MKPRSFLSPRRWMRLRDDEATFERRGFPLASPAREALERVGGSFVRGYNLALDAPAEELADRLNEVDLAHRGFAFEGAAMALALLDLLTPWRARRLETLLQGAGATHVYLMHVGAGWALARLRRKPHKLDARLDPLLRGLAIDGYGFHEGFFSWPRTVRDRAPAPFEGPTGRVYDQGLGRSLWFVKGADVEQIAETIAAFPAARHSDLWAGVGLACAYAGAVPEDAVRSLAELSGRHRAHLAQGICFAAKARARAGNVIPSTELACRVVWRQSTDAVAAIADASLPEDGDYERWRAAIRGHLEEPRAAAVALALAR